MKKSVYALFLMIFCVFSCFGSKIFAENVSFAFAESSPAASKIEAALKEENAFRIIRQTDESGKIALTYVFPINSHLLSEKGFSEQEISVCKFYLSTFVNALAKQNRNKAQEGTTVSACTFFSDVDGLGFSIIFDNVQAQKTFFGIEDDDNEKEDAAPTTSGFFIKKVQISTTFPVSTSKAADDLKSICNMAISAWCSDNNIEVSRRDDALSVLENSVFIYDFATFQDGLQSDLMYDDENFHHNFFIRSYADLEAGDNQIAFFTTYPNTPVWYATALVGVIVAMVVAYVVLNRKKGKRLK